MKLYYATGTCSLAPHIALRESGLPFELVKVNLKTHETDSGEDYYAINPKGYVPLLELDNGEKISEVAVIVQYISNQVPGKRLMPEEGSMQRYRALEWLSYVATELHKSFSPLFKDVYGEMAKEQSTKQLVKSFKFVDDRLEGKQYLLGDSFNVADAYLFVVSRWAYALNLPIDELQNLKMHFERMKDRPTVQEAMQKEGLKR